MPLSLFNHRSLSHFEEVNRVSQFGHTFGGRPADFDLTFSGIESPPHLLYRLNLEDPAFDVVLSGVRHLPLLYGFSYAHQDGVFSYQVHSDSEIEVISEADWPPDPDFPYKNYPIEFPHQSIAFERRPYDPSVAEDALRLAGVFRLEHLSEAELKRAIQTADDQGFFEGSGFPDWTLEEKLCITYDAPFMQGRPSRTCDNENCIAKVTGYIEPSKITFPPETPLIGGESIEIPGRVEREPSMRVFAIHEPRPTEHLLWRDPYVQLVFEFCECCHCIRVSNQCT